MHALQPNTPVASTIRTERDDLGSDASISQLVFVAGRLEIDQLHAKSEPLFAHAHASQSRKVSESILNLRSLTTTVRLASIPGLALSIAELCICMHGPLEELDPCQLRSIAFSQCKQEQRGWRRRHACWPSQSSALLADSLLCLQMCSPRSMAADAGLFL
ncbi:hypothetical protein BS78_09G198900 [Paspalum vaginatum]|nr:hypothetical protein BS78_09G198900 [Paspalum vaginatum]